MNIIWPTASEEKQLSVLIMHSPTLFPGCPARSFLMHLQELETVKTAELVSLIEQLYQDIYK